MPRKKKCKECNRLFDPQRPMQVCCGWVCASAYGKKQNEKARIRQAQRKAKKERELRASDRKRLEELKPLSKWRAEAQKSFNSYIRIRDKGKPCPSCFRGEREIESADGWKYGGAWDAGHYRSRGAAKQLAFNLLNVWRECKSCNGGGKYSHKDATKTKNYRISLIERIGLERVEQIENNNEIVRFDIEYMKRIKKIFNKRTRIYKRLFR